MPNDEQPSQAMSPEPAERSDKSLLDELMSLNPLAMIKSDPTAVDKLIAYYRRNRKRMAEGIKPQRPKKVAAAGSEIKLDLAALGIVKPTVVGLKRRV